jgi:exportin-1
MFTSIMTATNTMIPPSTNIADVYENSNDDDQEFVQNLALFLTGFLSAHLKVAYRVNYFDYSLTDSLFFLLGC